MRHRACMRHLLCMRTPVRLGVTDGAIDVTSAAVGKSGENRFHCVEVNRQKLCARVDPFWFGGEIRVPGCLAVTHAIRPGCLAGGSSGEAALFSRRANVFFKRR
jgi:hypothetical protein